MPEKAEFTEEELAKAHEKEIEKHVKEIMEEVPATKPQPFDGEQLLPTDKLPSVAQTKIEVSPVVPVAKLQEEDSDPVTAKAVDEIVAKESDDVLAAEDEKLDEAFLPKKKRNPRHKIKDFFSSIWDNPRHRKIFLASLAALVVLIATVPPSRYFVLNTVGVRAGASMTVLDDKTSQPLKNVKVTLGGASSMTDQDGQVRLSRVKLGASDLVVEKRAFAVNKKRITVGWGSNPLGEVRLTPTGSQYAFIVTDFLSGKPIAKIEAASGDASALSDKDGKIVLTVEESEAPRLKVMLSGTDYRTEELDIDADNHAEQAIKMTPSRKHVFISKRSGKFDVYKIDADGKNEEKLLAGTGSEREDMALAHHPTEELVALVSTRDNQRNKDGFLLSTLVIIDVKTGQLTSLGASERVQIVGWLGERLVYVKIAEGTSAGNPKRHRLISYNYKDDSSKELASANYFNDIVAANGVIYFAPADTYQAGDNIGLFRIYPDGTNKQTILNKEVWNLFRTEYNKLTISVPSEWFEYKLGDATANKVAGQPSVLKSRLYMNSPDGSHSLWVDQRDGKGVLLIYTVGDQAEKIIQNRSGLNAPVRWLNNNYVVFRVNNGQEIADYVMNLDGGDPKKIKDVTSTSGIDSWYYY